MSDQNTAAPLIPMRDFFRNPEVAGFQISPDGAQLAFLKPWNNRLNVYVCDLDGGNERRLTSATKRDIRIMFWKGNTRIVFLQDDGGDENWHIFVADLGAQAGTERDLTPFPGALADVVDDLEDNDQEMIVAINNRDPQVLDVFRLNVDTGDLTMIAQNPGSVVGWITDNAGNVRLATESDGVTANLLYRKTPQDPFHTIITTDFRQTCQPLFFDFDDAHFFAASNIGRDKMAIVRYDPDANQEVQVLFTHPDVDADDLYRSKIRKVITAIGFTTWKPEYHFLDAVTEARHRYLAEKFPGRQVNVTSITRDESRMVVTVSGDHYPATFHYYDAQSGDVRLLATARPWLNEDHLAVTAPISYTSRDGLTIHGYLTLPRGLDPVNLPVVVHPHGGPWHRDVWGYDPEVQFLANRGYAVLQMNFRGSTGYGRAFWEASFKQWGRAMQDDITDGVQWLIAQGIADPKRVGIYGASYGGYATLAGLTFTPDLYACGVDYVGVSNLITFQETFPPYWLPMLQMSYEMVGHPENDAEMLRAGSPALNAHRITAPLLVAQGANDPRVKKAESDQMVEALRARGVEVEYMVKDDEGHGFSNQENKFQFNRAMELFLSQHLGGRAE